MHEHFIGVEIDRNLRIIIGFVIAMTLRLR